MLPEVVNEDEQIAALAGLVEDDCARTILVATREEPMSVTELADAADVSEPTVRRRLDDLTDHGLVEESMRLDDAGHHRHTYRAVVERLTFTVEPDGVSVEVSRAGTMADRFTRYVREM